MKANFENIYSKIGYLFYAVASEEMKLPSIDYERLRKLVAKKWQPELDGSTPLQIQLVEGMYNSIWVGFHSHMNSGTAFELFKECYMVHNLNFSVSLREKILVTVRDIARNFHTVLNGYNSGLLKNVEYLLTESRVVSATVLQTNSTQMRAGTV